MLKNHSVGYMNRRRLPSAVRNMDWTTRSKLKNLAINGGIGDYFGFSGSLFDELSSTLTTEDMNLWKMPTPPQSPPRDELPESEDSVNLAQFAKLDSDITSMDYSEDIDKCALDSALVGSVLDTDISELIDFVSTEIEEFSPDTGLLPLIHPIKACDDDVMMRGDIMWSESLKEERTPSFKRDPTLSTLWDCPLKEGTGSALSVALQSDVLPPFPALTKSRSMDELSYREKSLALGTDTPSDSEEEIDVVNTEESEKRPVLPDISPEDLRVRVTAKRAAAAGQPEVQIEVHSTANACYCPSANSPGAHHHHIPVDHHNYSLPPSPAQPTRRAPTHSRQTSPDTRCVRDSTPVQFRTVTDNVVEQALTQAMQLKTEQRTQRGQGVRRAGQKKRRRVSKSQAVGTTSRQFVPVSTSPSITTHTPIVPLGSSNGAGRRRQELLQGLEEDGDRRNQHNVLERNRRILLSGKFTSLKMLVPSIQDQDKASKVVILNNAESHVRELRSQELHLLREHRSLKARNDMLKKRLAELKKC